MLLGRMIRILGPIDMEILASGQDTYKYFTKENDMHHINEDTNQLKYIIPEESSLEDHLQISDVGLANFLRDILEINPLKHITVSEALEHPWLSYSYSYDSSFC
ncbi:Serine/threonine-protein kinase ppk5 [Heracleum sosnowskyi]|uniref:Serine/threonine-protein kinase ppk5 n=1 Tax=Heracleum sosnowskyi TaxID=360622 RepID=A0AAD8H573_9APIA|nr:Serine/threonine-protein kinase ppk5 [Heracleum sosnowskyi]